MNDQTDQVAVIARAAGIQVERMKGPIGVDGETGFVAQAVRVIDAERFVRSLAPNSKLWLYRAYMAPGDELLTIRHYSRSLTPKLAERERILAIVDEIESYYPLDVFPEPEPGCAPDRYSAAMARRVCAQLRKRIIEA